MYVGLKQPLGDGERCVTPARAAAKETSLKWVKIESVMFVDTQKMFDKILNPFLLTFREIYFALFQFLSYLSCTVDLGTKTNVWNTLFF